MTSDEIKLDLDRDRRLGFGEAIFCQDKSAAQIAAILDVAVTDGHAMLLTRLSRESFAELPQRLASCLDFHPQSQTAFCGNRPLLCSQAGSVAILTAGTSDAAVAREAQRTLAFHAIESSTYFDVGVAGLWRLLERLDEIRRHRIVIAIAGMDAALPTVLGGLITQPLIAVPTSTGYGASRNGETALAASLTSCAPGIVVCNIDNGYGAACAAIRILVALHANDRN